MRNQVSGDVSGARGAGGANKGQAIRFLLFRYLVSSWMARKTRSQATIGVLLPILGVGIGVCAFTVVLSVMAGFVEGLKGRLLGLESHIEIIVSEGFGRVPAKPELIEKLPQWSSEVVAATPFQKGDAILMSNSRPTTVTLLGLDPDLGKRATGFEGFFLSEKDLGVLGSDQPVLGVFPETRFPPIVLGRDLLGILGVDVGDRITLVSTTPEEGPLGLAPKQYPVVVADAFSSGSPQHDAKLALVSLSLASDFFDAGDEWAGVIVKLKNPLEADQVARALDVHLKGLGLRAKPWTESNKALLRALKLERWGMSFVLSMVIIVGCFSITITLVLAVKRKGREMAVLRALGLERRDLGRLYLLKGLTVGLIGVGWGLGLGLAILAVISRVQIPLLTSAYSGRPLPVLIDWGTLAFVSAGSVVLAVIAAVWPAAEVMRIDVVETLSDRT